MISDIGKEQEARRSFVHYNTILQFQEKITQTKVKQRTFLTG